MNMCYKTIKIIAGIIFGAHIIISIQYYIIKFIKINYLYPSIEWDFFDIIPVWIFEFIIGIIVPLVLLKCIDLIQKKSKKKIINLIMFPVIIVFLSINCFAWSVYSYLFAIEELYSHTEDVANFGLYDDFVAETIEEYELNKFLPEEDIVKKYGNYDYSYEYMYSLKEHTFVIKTKVQFPDNDSYKKELNRIHNINSPTEVTVDNIYCDYYGYIYSEPVSKPWEGAVLDRLKSAVFDDASKTIIYVIEYGVRDSFLEDYLQTKSDNNN